MLLIPTLLCPKPWENMPGDDTQRFCTYCKKHVHNLEALSVSERLALLSSPAASICSRYQVAIRRPVHGHEESYLRHLLKYGAGVALTGTVLLVLWEMHAHSDRAAWQSQSHVFYRTATANGPILMEMPRQFYLERETRLVGDVYLPPKVPSNPVLHVPAVESPPHIDLQLDPIEVNRLLELSTPNLPLPDANPR